MRVHVVPLVALFYALALSCLLLVSNPYVLLVTAPMQSAYRVFEPVMHLICFAGLGGLAMFAQGALPRRATWGGLLLLAVASEVLQGVVPGRTPELADLIQNLLGVAVGAGVAGLLLLVTSPVQRQSFVQAKQRFSRWIATFDKAFAAKRPRYY